MILSPHAHDTACDLLGLPHGTQLTIAQVLAASSIEVLNARRKVCDHCQPNNPCRVHQ